MNIKGLDAGQRPALVISEMQVAMTHADDTGVAGLNQQVRDRGIVARLAALSALCREVDVPVIHCTIVALPKFAAWVASCKLQANIVKRGALCSDDPRSAIDPGLALQPGDIVSQRMHGITGLLAGVSTNIALPGMSTEAVNRGFNVVIPEDCTAGGTAESHAFQIRNHLPFLATISDAQSVGQVLREHLWQRATAAK